MMCYKSIHSVPNLASAGGKVDFFITNLPALHFVNQTGRSVQFFRWKTSVTVKSLRCKEKKFNHFIQSENFGVRLDRYGFVTYSANKT